MTPECDPINQSGVCKSDQIRSYSLRDSTKAMTEKRETMPRAAWRESVARLESLALLIFQNSSQAKYLFWGLSFSVATGVLSPAAN